MTDKDTLVEKVAIALHEETFVGTDWDIIDWSEVSTHDKSIYQKNARAAIHIVLKEMQNDSATIYYLDDGVYRECSLDDYIKKIAKDKGVELE